MAAGTTGPARMDALARREQILSCAMHLFEQRPYAEVSAGDIAAAAGVARPLVHHYFGTKRELYLETVRRITYLPPLVLSDLPAESLEAKVDAIVEHWLRVVSRHRRMWLAAINVGGQGDPDVAEIIRKADTADADRVLDALGIALDGNRRTVLRAALVSYAAMAKELSRQWLVSGTLTRDEVHRIARSGLLALVVEFQDEAGDEPGDS